MLSLPPAVRSHPSPSPSVPVLLCCWLSSPLLWAVLYSLPWPSAPEEDPLCGQLEVHKQQWIDPAGRQIGGPEFSGDLQECLAKCCAVPGCSAVTFSGFLGPSAVPGSANCSLFECSADGGQCPLVATDDRRRAEEGVLSVLLRRSQAPENTNASSPLTVSPTLRGPTTPSGPSSSTESAEGEGRGDQEGEEQLEQINRTNNWTTREPEGGNEESDQGGQILPLGKDEVEEGGTRTTTPAGQPNSTDAKSLLDLGSWDERFPLRADMTPVWAIGLGMVVTVVCLGLLLALLGFLLCYRRYRSRMRSTEISGPKKMPTLHAFNPS